MLERRFCLALEFRDDALGQHLTQLNTPLVKRIKVPDCALSENGVLVERYQLAQRFRSEPFSENHVGGAVALRDAMWRQPGRGRPRLDLLATFAKTNGVRTHRDD